MNILYTVKEVADISSVTIKTLHHYHKIGLLIPNQINEKGYRYYNDENINRLQLILFYRSLDFSLEDIQQLLDNSESRMEVLKSQKILLEERKEEVTEILATLEKSILEEENKMKMKPEDKFKGLEHVNELESTLQNATVILSKPMYIQYLIIGIMLSVVFGGFIFTGKINDYANAEPGTYTFWLSSLPKEGVVIACWAFLLLGIVTTAYSIKMLFFTKTKDLLEEINKGKTSVKAKEEEE